MQFVLFGDDMSDNESNGTTSAEDHITNDIRLVDVREKVTKGQKNKVEIVITENKMLTTSIQR